MKTITLFRFFSALAMVCCLSTILISCSENDSEAKVSFITKATADSQSVTISAQASSKVQEKGFLFSETPGITVDNAERLFAGNSKSERFAVIKVNLQRNTAYYFRPFAVISGETFMGTEEMFFTQP